jgi:two-component system, OmpR family, sensor kinase
MKAGHWRRRRAQFDGRPLRHRIFFSLGVTIVLAVAVAGMVVHAAVGSAKQQHVFESFASDRFRVVWDDAPRREDFARSIEGHFKVRLALRDARGNLLYGTGIDCERGSHRLEVRDGSRVLGHVEACVLPHGWPKSLVLGLGSLVLALWAMSGLIARRLVRPLDDLVKVVRDIGEGHLDARMQLCQHGHRGELGVVARAVNSMAEKIERQIAAQRELLAAVSHEIRSPLGRLRMLVELEREGQGDSARLDSMDLELKEMDGLVGQLLAQSRLEFQNLELRSLSAIELAQMALERASISSDLLVDEAKGEKVMVDVSLLGRALLNLLDNAQRHGMGLAAFVVRLEGEWITFEIKDEGPGFDAGLLPRAFEPFVGGAKGGGLGLGLSLVDRIVRAHKGRVRLANAEHGGAVVTVELPRAPAT